MKSNAETSHDLDRHAGTTCTAWKVFRQLYVFKVCFSSI